MKITTITKSNDGQWFESNDSEDSRRIPPFTWMKNPENGFRKKAAFFGLKGQLLN